MKESGREMAKPNNKLKLFISYSHKDNQGDEEFIQEFKEHTCLLKTNGLIMDWYDREILPGDDWQQSIDNNLEDADIICLFISRNFLFSENCIKEKEKALKLRKKKHIHVIPIILSHCKWSDDEDLKKILALPTDGMPISDFDDKNKGWIEVYDGIKKVIEHHHLTSNLIIKDEFLSYLNDAELLAKAHSQKEKITINDIFVYPDFDEFNCLKEPKDKVKSSEFIENFIEYQKVVIAGEDQSGKTTLCKKFFLDLCEFNFIPVYIQVVKGQMLGNIDKVVKRNFSEQYSGVSFDIIDKSLIVPIIDNFHHSKNKEKHITSLNDYKYSIIIVDDVYRLNIKDEKILSSYTHFKIRELGHSIRSELIKKWIAITEYQNGGSYHDNDMYQDLDKATELIDTALGKIMGSGIMPSYPFFILTIVSSYETLKKPLNQEITSQGYCYETLIILYLTKERVKGEDMDTYINFLSELASYVFKTKKYELAKEEYSTFLKEYCLKFNLHIKDEIIIKKLNRAQIIKIDSANNYSFSHLYLYYFFVGKYLADNYDDNIHIIDDIYKNLHVNEYAYILIFMSHHSKNPLIINNLLDVSKELFSDLSPSTLSKKELSFFDEQAKLIVEAVLPPGNSTPESVRDQRLKILDEMEEANNNLTMKKNSEIDETEIQMRRAVKTLEAMGQIIKNRAGSLDKMEIDRVFSEGLNLQLRMLTYFFNIIRDEENQKEIISLISKRLEHIIENKDEEISREEIRELSNDIFWNINFIITYGIIEKIVHSLGSDKLLSIAESTCDKEDHPAADLVKHGILMWYGKNIQINKIGKSLSDKKNSQLARRIMRFQIVGHCSMHLIDYRERQKIIQQLGIPPYILQSTCKKRELN